MSAYRALADSAGIPGANAGIVTYGSADGLEQIAGVARTLNLSVILGIFEPNNTAEVANAERVLGDTDVRPAIAGCCVGNEAITFRRATIDEIKAVAVHLRRQYGIPVATTEIIQAYGNERLFEFDFTLANAHGLFSGIHTPERAAEWAGERVIDLVAEAPAGHVVLIKELGWPSGPEPVFDHEQQVAYWKAVFADSSSRKANICIFDSFKNVSWKQEVVRIEGQEVNIGPYWPVLFDDARQPTEFAHEILKLWKRSRTRKSK